MKGSKQNPTYVQPIWIKRNHKAPSFSHTLVGNRLQIIIERYLQYQVKNINEYISKNRILKFVIPTETIQQWYPTPNWKKDIKNTLSLLDKSTENFLFAHAILVEGGLHISITPQTLRNYVISNTMPYYCIDYNVTKHFLCKYSHEIYLRICQYNNDSNSHSFLLRPEEINQCFKTQYNVTNIKKNILIAAQKEMQQLYKYGIFSPYITYETIKRFENPRKIAGYKVTILSTSRNTTFTPSPNSTTQATEQRQQLLKETSPLQHKQPSLYKKYLSKQIKKRDNKNMKKMEETFKILEKRLKEAQQNYNREINFIISQILDIWKDYLNSPPSL